MAAISITAASCKPSTGAISAHGIAGVAITAGQLVYLEASSGKYKLTDADSATAEVRAVAGIAACNAAADQPLAVQIDGLITIGATVAAGTSYYSSATAGGIAPVADNTTGVYPTFIGFGVSTTQIDINIVSAGVVVP